MRALVAEAVGTFALVFAGTGAIVIDDITHSVTHVGIALTFGLVIMVMIDALGDISGAHFNPAVTVGFWLSRRFSGRHVIPYIAAQLAGAFAASLTLLCIFGNRASLGATLPSGIPWHSFVLEIILTGLLVLVILRVSDRTATPSAMPAIAIGGTVGLEALFAGPITGASMNPARSLAPALVSQDFSSLWIYLVAPMLGALLAVGLNTVLRNRVPNNQTPISL